jgi:hypothetical protein
MPPFDPFAYEKLTLIGGLVMVVLAFVFEFVVAAPTHKALRADRDDWRARCDRLTAIAEMALRNRVERPS